MPPTPSPSTLHPFAAPQARRPSPASPPLAQPPPAQPPPPLALRRERPAPDLDGALGDTELAAARTALTQGRWQAARSLLLRTGDAWDRRGHQVTVLARESYAAAWARDWLLTEPRSADASVLLALTLVSRALRGREDPARARQSCRTAAGLAPADPTPWLGLLLLERRLGSWGGMVRSFAETRRRHPEHHHAHHLMAARLAERHPDRGADPRHEVYAFAGRCADRAPADSPLAVLPLVAHAECYRVLAARGLIPADPVASGHWSAPSAQHLVRSAYDWWLEWEQDDQHPRRHVDLNFLAHATSCAGRDAEAAALFQRIGPHVTRAPWSYPDRDPYAAFHTARARARSRAF